MFRNVRPGLGLRRTPSGGSRVLDLVAVYTLSNPNLCIITVFILIATPQLQRGLLVHS